MNQNNQNVQLKFTRRSSLSDGHYVSMPDERLTLTRLAGGLFCAAAFILAFIYIAAYL